MKVKKLNINPLYPLGKLSWPFKLIVAILPVELLLFGLPALPAIFSETPAMVFYPCFFFATYLGGFWAGLAATFSCLAYAGTVLYPNFYLSPFQELAINVRAYVFLVTCLLFLFLMRALKRELDRSKKALALRDEFIDLASHELKNPLTALKLNLESARMMMEDSDNSDLNPKFLLASLRQLNRIENLVASMMDTTLFESGQVTLRCEECDLVEIVRNVLLNTQYDELSFSSEDKNVIGSWDKIRTEQIISNLIDNAIKYGAGKPVSVTLIKVQDQIQFTVLDSGKGISKQDQKNIFEKFKRVNSNNKVEGLGLGLYLTKKLVELHKGQITVKSSVGQGSSFTVTLPINLQRAHF
jgi:signal transduction histidine kinase